MKKITLAFLLSLLFVATGCAKTNSSYNHTLKVGSENLAVELASTPAQRDLGLSGRNTMGENQGMLFIFRPNETLYPAFWMKGMKFDLDFIWVQNGRVVGITPQAPSQEKLNLPDSQLPTYSPPQPITWVVEVNAGFSQRHHIQIGDQVTLKN